jgi:hypothetical protein
MASLQIGTTFVLGVSSRFRPGDISYRDQLNGAAPEIRRLLRLVQAVAA